MNGQLTSKKDWTKADWRRYNREAQEKARVLQAKGRIEAVENKMANLLFQAKALQEAAKVMFQKMMEETLELEIEAALYLDAWETKRFELYELLYGADFLPEWLARWERED